MPEGPSILILKETLKPFEGKKVIAVEGNAKIDLKRIKGKKIIELQSWGKQLFICFNGFFLRIHLLMFGSYRINEKKDTAPRLNLTFVRGEINFYNCSIKLLEGAPGDLYDMESDVLSDLWNAAKAEKKLKALKKENVCDTLLNQEIFSGVGNIIKNEVLFLLKIHPKSVTGKLPAKKLKALIKLARDYSWDFYHWKKAFELRKHWQIYFKSECPRCKIHSKKEYLGKGNRLTFYCDNCQELYK